MNEDESETTGQRTDDPMLDHACTMRIALAIVRRQNELDLRLRRIEQAGKHEHGAAAVHGKQQMLANQQAQQSAQPTPQQETTVIPTSEE